MDTQQVVSLSVSNIVSMSIFVFGYLAIMFEHRLGVNKATPAIIMAVLLWIVQFADPLLTSTAQHELNQHLAEVSQIILFLLGALAIVEIIHVHGGLGMVSRLMQVQSKRLALFVVGLVTFFLSAILDNLTTTIVMVVMLKKIVRESEDRLLFGSVVVIAANAGGAWTPIGDVTTTMLWVGGQISAFSIMKALFIPSILCLLGALACIIPKVSGKLDINEQDPLDKKQPKSRTILTVGLFLLMFVPLFKGITGLPPFMGILFSLGIMWLLTDLLHRQHADRDHLRVISVLPRLDLSGILFFLGILLAVGALETAGVLRDLALWLDSVIPSKEAIGVIIGIISAVVDNVPLVAASMGMYSIVSFPTDSPFWELIAYCAGTGGSLLVIGSAAGVAFMGLEKVDFFWYVRRVGVAALVGYLLGVAAYLLGGLL